MIGKTILDSIGWTEKLGGTIQPKIKPIVEMNTTQFDEFKAYLDKIEKDPVQVDLYLKAHGLEQVEGLKDYILNNDIKQGSVNNLIQTQNYKNIANQAHGFKGIKKALDEYNAGITKAGFNTEKFVSTISSSNSSFGNYLSSLKDANGQYHKADIGLGGYAGSLITATAKTVALQAATMALNTAISMGISFVISEVISVISACATASDRLKESASELGSQFSSTKSDIEGYKAKISDLYETINDSSSSYEDTYNARQELLTIQDEMIEKFGNEAEAVRLVTEAVNGQTDAFDKLTKYEWDEAVRKFNFDPDKKWTEKFSDGWANFWSDSSNNYERMKKEMEDATVDFTVNPKINDKNYIKFIETIQSDFNANVDPFFDSSINTYKNTISFSGDLNDIYSRMQSIYTLAQDMGLDDSYVNVLSEQMEKVKGTLEDYNEFYNSSVLNEKIYGNESYEESLNSIKEAYKEYKAAFAAGDEDMINQAKQSFAEIVQSATDGITDQSVIDYFNTLYPELQDVVGKWELKVHFKAAIEDDKDDFENDIKDISEQFGTVENIKYYDPKTATDEQKTAMAKANLIADNAHLTFDQFIEWLEEMGKLSSMAKDDLADKLSFGKNKNTSAGITSVTNASASQADTDVVKKWTDSISDEDAKFALNSTEFEEAVERRKAELNGAALSASDYSAALEEAKRKQNELSDDENPISLSDRFKDLWDSESFKDAKENLEKLAKESKITADDINSLARENETLSGLLDESGMSAQFAAECFDSMSRGGKGFDAITNDALLLDQVLNGMTASLQHAKAAKSAYDEAMSKDDYNAEFKNYQEAYAAAKEMFKNGEFGSHFRDTMEYLLGEDSYTMGIEELEKACKSLDKVFGENAANGYEFLDKLYANRKVLDGLDSSLKKLSDGSYEFDLKPDEFEEIADALNMTTDEVTACTNALGMFGDYRSYDLDELELAMNAISIAANDGKKSITSLQGVENILKDLGYTGYDTYHILQDIREMGSVKLIDFEEGNVDKIISKLKQLEMIHIDGKNINLDSLIAGMKQLGNSDTDIAGFIARLNGQFNLTDAQGKLVDFETAKKKALSASENEASKEMSKVGDNAESSAKNVSDLGTEIDRVNGKSLSEVQLQFVNVSTAAKNAENNVRKIIERINALNNTEISVSGSSSGNKTPDSTPDKPSGKPSGKKGYNGTVGSAFSSGTLDEYKNLPVTGYNGLPHNEKNALRSEYGQPELTVYPDGKTELTTKPVMSDLPKGTVIFNEEQTEKIMNGRKKASGNAFASGTVRKYTSKYYGSDQDKKTSSESKSTRKIKSEEKARNEEVFDWIERKLDILQKKIDATKAKFENLFSVKSKASNLKKQINQTTTLLKASEKAAKAYKKYADKVKLSKDLKKKVREGNYNIKDYDSKTSEQINKYKEYYDKYKDLQKQIDELKTQIRETTEEKYQLYVDQADAQLEKSQAHQALDEGNYKEQNKHLEKQKEYLEESYKYQIKIAQLNEDKVEESRLRAELEQKIRDLTKEEFDNISAEYENKIGYISSKIDTINAMMEQLETRGYVASASYYNRLAEQENKNLAQLREERDALQKQLDKGLKDGSIVEGTTAWYEMVDAINEVDKATIEAETSLIEYKNQLMQLEWKAFDRMQDYISGIQNESDFLIELMQNDKLFNADSGEWTKFADATAGLHAVNYNAYMSQADDYAKEIQKINQKLAEDPYNTILIDRKKELVNAQMEAIKSAENEKQAIKDLVSDGYDVMLDALQKIIDKRKELLDSEKNLYDYEKKISEQTKNISSLEKQKLALSGDSSEETKAKLQQITLQLDEAKDDLAESEYEQWKTDQESMLDKLADDAEEWISQRLDDIDGLVSDVISSTNSGSSNIQNTLESVGKDVGYTMSEEMDSIWDSSCNIVSMYGDDFSSQLTTVNNTLAEIRNFVSDMQKNSEWESVVNGGIDLKDIMNSSNHKTLANDKNSSNKETNTKNQNMFTGKVVISTSGAKDNEQGKKSSTDTSWGSWFVKKKYSGNKSSLNKNGSIIDRLKYFDFDSSLSRRGKYYKAMGGSGTYNSTSQQNQWMINEMKKHGFRHGGTIGKAISSSGEDGFVLARTGEEILSLEKINALKDTFVKIEPLIDTVRAKVDLPNIPRSEGVSQNFDNVNVDINLPNVKNYDEFKSELIKDRHFEKVIQSMTLGNALGRNSLNKFRI